MDELQCTTVRAVLTSLREGLTKLQFIEGELDGSIEAVIVEGCTGDLMDLIQRLQRAL